MQRRPHNVEELVQARPRLGGGTQFQTQARFALWQILQHSGHAALLHLGQPDHTLGHVGDVVVDVIVDTGASDRASVHSDILGDIVVGNIVVGTVASVRASVHSDILGDRGFVTVATVTVIDDNKCCGQCHDSLKLRRAARRGGGLVAGRRRRRR